MQNARYIQSHNHKATDSSETSVHTTTLRDNTIKENLGLTFYSFCNHSEFSDMNYFLQQRDTAASTLTFILLTWRIW